MIQLSIIVSVYKVEEYIRDYMESLFRQGLTDDIFELIIINDGTPDHSMDVVADIINAHDNIRVVNQANQGLSVALNVGLGMAKGEYILFNDPDDLLVENSVGPLLAHAMSSKPDVVLAQFVTFADEDVSTPLHVNQEALQSEEKTGRDILLKVLSPYCCYKWRALYLRRFLLENNIGFVPGIYFQDIPFIHECYLKARRCLLTNWTIYRYRVRRLGSATNTFYYKKAMDFSIVVKELWKLSLMEGITAEERLKVRDDAFVTLICLIRWTVTRIDSAKERREIMDRLHKDTLHMRFSNGWRQRVVTILLHHFPRLFLFIQELRKR
ncbi:MAG: glycosyltransferase [Prevotella sp.]|nr:glycosyltransferase [Prevotella sp.]